MAVLFGIAAGAWAADKPLPSDQEIGDRITSANAQSKSNLSHYSVIRTYKLHSSRLAKDATMTVRLEYNGKGASYEVQSVEDASFVSKKVLNKIIESEAEASRKEGELDIVNANYRFHVVGTATQNGAACYIVDLIPKRSSRYLLQGKAWVDQAEFAIVRLEGRPAANIGFGAGKPYLVIDFQRVGPFWMAAHNRSETHSFLFGSSVLTVDFSGYDIPSSSFKTVTTAAARNNRQIARATQ